VKNSRFEVQEIEYHVDAAISPFYYLTDIVCAYICRACYRESDYNDYELRSEHLLSMEDELQRSYGLESRFWTYSETDRLFRRAVERFQSGDLVQCLDYIYQIIESGEEFASFYVQRLIPKLEHFIQKVYVSKDVNFAVQRQAFISMVESFVNEAVTYVRGRGQYKKAGYIAGYLLDIVNNLDISNKECILYELYDILLCVENHNGSVKESKKYLQKITRYSSYVSHEKYQESVNRAMQIYFNSFMFEEITELYELLILSAEQLKNSYQEQLSTTQEIIKYFDLESNEEVPQIRLKGLGKLYSTQAQAYAFQQDYLKACECFNKALREFEKGSPDYYITLSYYLHCMVSMSDYENYRVMSAHYFGTDDIEQQIRKLIRGKSFVELFSLRFSLWIWLKSFYVFREQMTDFKLGDQRKTIKFVIDALTSAKSERIKAHPWEFIYKYLYLIGKEIKLSSELFEHYREWAITIDKSHHTDSDQEALSAIKYYIRYSLNSEYSVEDLVADLKPIALEGLKGLEHVESAAAYVNSKFTYMYQ
jgi:tetratricopeptide (TPR) repeat protein